MSQGAEDQALPATETARDVISMDDSALAARWLPQETAEPVEEVPEVKVEEVPVVEETPAETTNDEPVDDNGDNGEAAVEEDKTPPPAKPQLTKFEVVEGNDEVELPENIKFRFKANGKDYEVPADKLVLFAQSGIYNHDREQSFKAEKATVEQAKQELDRLRAENAQYDSYFKRILEDEDFRTTAVQEYEQLNTPEAKLQRLEQQRVQEQHYMRQQQEDMQIQAFTRSIVSPAMERLLQENPTVTQQELLGRFTELTAPILVRGRIPLDRLPTVAHLVSSDLTQWVKGRHAERELEGQTKSAEVEKARKDAAQLKRQVARAVAPKTSAPGAGPVDKAKPPKSANEWFKNRFSTGNED